MAAGLPKAGDLLVVGSFDLIYGPSPDQTYDILAVKGEKVEVDTWGEIPISQIWLLGGAGYDNLLMPMERPGTPVWGANRSELPRRRRGLA